MENYTAIIDGKEVTFEPIEIIDKQGHSNDWSMDGYTGDKLTHAAIGSYTFFDEFEELSDIIAE